VIGFLSLVRSPKGLVSLTPRSFALRGVAFFSIERKRQLPSSTTAYKCPVRSRAGLSCGAGKRIVVPIVIQLAFSPVMLWP